LEEIRTVLKLNPIKMRIFTQGQEVSLNLTNFMQNRRRTAITQGRWIQVELNQIVPLMDSIIEFLVTEDTASELLRIMEQNMQEFSDTALSELGRGHSRNRTLADLRHILFSPEPVSGELEVEISDEIVMYHTYVTLFLALLLYESIFRNYDQLRRIEFYRDGLALDPLQSLHSAFSKVNDEIDYESVFTVALDVISALRDISPGGQIADRLRRINNQVQQIYANRALLRQDFIGRVYHRVTGDLPLRKGFATFYTKAEIASFLSELVLNHYTSFWDDRVEASGPAPEVKVGDFSCGSGTLLSATYSSILGKIRIMQGEVDKQQLVEFHHKMIEKVIWGIDALENAVQAASVVLALHEPGTPLDNFNTLRDPIRISGELGSISLWEKPTVILRRHGIRGTKDETVTVPSFDFIISNPPFSRNTAPGTEEGAKPRIFGFVTNEAAYESLIGSYKGVLSEMEQYILSSEATSKLINDNVGTGKPFRSADVNPLNSGAFFPFVVMYEKYLKSDGIMALVLPLSVLEASSNLMLRALMLSHFSVDFIVISTDSNNTNFSYSTNLSECLIILKKQNHSRDKECTIVKIAEQPRNTLEGILMARRLARGLVSSDSTLNSQFEYRKVKQDTLKEMLWNWGPVARYPQSLLSALDELLNGKIFGVDFAPRKLGDFLSKNSDGLIGNPRAYRGTFISDNMVENSNGPYKFLSEAGRSVMDKIQLRPDYRQKRYIQSGTSSGAGNINAGHIVVPESFRLNTMPLISSFTPEFVFSGVAYSITTGDLSTDKALTTWMNSVFGILMLRTFFSTVAGNFGHIRGWHLRSWPIPDFYDSNLVNSLEDIFNRYAGETWQPIPLQLSEGSFNLDSNRHKFDVDIIKAICPNLGLNEINRELNGIYTGLLTTISEEGSRTRNSLNPQSSTLDDQYN
ncbi:MAG: N-6 DNA methylase, partial [Thermoplasmatales archaeon]